MLKTTPTHLQKKSENIINNDHACRRLLTQVKSSFEIIEFLIDRIGILSWEDPSKSDALFEMPLIRSIKRLTIGNDPPFTSRFEILL